MRRFVLVSAAFALTGLAGARLVDDARAARRGALSVPRLIADAAPAGPRLVIVFQPEDCLGDGEVVRRWNALGAEPSFRATALVIGGLDSRRRQALERAGLRLPLMSIPPLDAELIAGMLGHARTPFAVVLDARGRVAASYPATRTVPAEAIRRLIAAG